MKRSLLFALSVLLSAGLYADVIVYPSQTVGKIKPMNAVNNGPKPTKEDQKTGNFQAWKDLKLPFARTHDAAFCSFYGGEHTVDISAIFPDFSKKVDDPASYDFAYTDYYLSWIRKGGADVFFRLGQKIENSVTLDKKYNVYPPKDYKKFAQICEHIIRHYNEGWDNGFHWNIRYWEIWNEPDLDEGGELYKKSPRTWGGTAQQYFELFEVTAKHLKKNFPNLKIGGPALAGNQNWADRFFTYMRNKKVPIDFYSWHIYSTSPKAIADLATQTRKKIDSFGYGDAESILNEWNYVKGWSAEWKYSLKAINGMKGAAFAAMTMNLCQNVPLDILMYYDTRIGSSMNGFFDPITLEPQLTYYAYYAWMKIRDLGTQVKATADQKDISVVAAKNDAGKCGVFVVRYNDDNNKEDITEDVTIRLNSGSLENATAHLTDSEHIYTEVPVHGKDGAITFSMLPNSFVFVEF